MIDFKELRREFKVDSPYLNQKAKEETSFDEWNKPIRREHDKQLKKMGHKIDHRSIRQGKYKNSEEEARLDQLQAIENSLHAKIASLSSIDRVMSFLSNTEELNVNHLVTALRRIMNLKYFERKREKIKQSSRPSLPGNTAPKKEHYNEGPIKERIDYLVEEIANNIEHLNETSIFTLLILFRIGNHKYRLKILKPLCSFVSWV